MIPKCILVTQVQYIVQVHCACVGNRGLPLCPRYAVSRNALVSKVFQGVPWCLRYVKIFPSVQCMSGFALVTKMC